MSKKKREPTADAVEIIHRRFYEGRPERIAGLEAVCAEEARNREDFDGYTPELVQDEKGDWLAHLEEFPNVSALAPTPEAACAELKIAWHGVKESYRARGEGEPIPVYRGSGNVFADLGLEDAEELQQKSEQLFRISQAMERRGMKDEDAARFLSLEETFFARLVRGREFDAYTVEQLAQFADEIEDTTIAEERLANPGERVTMEEVEREFTKEQDE